MRQAYDGIWSNTEAVPRRIQRHTLTAFGGRPLILFRDLPLIHKNVPPLHLKQALMSVERRKVEQHVIVGSLQPIIVGKQKILSGFSENLHFLSVLTELPWTNTFTSEKTLCKYV